MKLSTAPVRRRLHDGSEVLIGPVAVADVYRLRRFFEGLSPTSRYLRFLSPAFRPRRAALDHVVAVDHERREALVALDAADEVVGLAQYEGARSGPTAEVAIVVADAWQHRGLATRLVVALAERALDRGYQGFSATMLGENRAALALLRKVSPEAEARLAHAEYSVYAPLRRARSDRSPTR